jgi:DNA polymerase-3 subunit delta'
VPGFGSIIDQEQPIQILTTFIKKGTIPHALLFTGIEGVGKLAAAMTFAMACNCITQMQNEKKAQNKSGPCDQCRSCKKINSGNHPDIIHIKPSGHFIKIAQIRSLCQTLAMKPYEARLRVVIISDAQAMNPEAGNALLKVLEEPPDHTILILITMQRSDLLPTIVSRCRHIRFSPISQKILEALLVQEKGVDPDEAIIIAAMANGSFTKAVSMSQTNWINKRNWLIKAIGLDQPESLSSKPLALILAFSERLSKNREILLDSLEIIKSWLRDLVIYKYYPEKIINKDLADKIQYASQKVTVKSLLLQTEAIQSAQKNIQSNANLRLTLDVMATRLARLSNC